jgi:hypothetical protein
MLQCGWRHAAPAFLHRGIGMAGSVMPGAGSAMPGHA